MLTPKDSWLESDKWALNRIIKGLPVDFNQEYGYLDAKTVHKLPQNEAAKRTLSSDFLDTILSIDSKHSPLGRKGLAIIGAVFKENLDLQNMVVSHEINIIGSLFLGIVNFRNIITSRPLSFEASIITEPLIMHYCKLRATFSLHNTYLDALLMGGAQVDGQLNLTEVNECQLIFCPGATMYSDVILDGGIFNKVNFSGSSVGGDFLANNTEIKNGLELDKVKVSGNLVCAKSKINRAVVRGAQIQSQLDFSQSEVAEELAMDSVDVGADILLHDGKYNVVKLFDSKIMGRIDMSDANLEGKINFDRMRVGASVFLNDVNCKDVRMGGAQIGSQLIMEGVTQTDPETIINLDDIQVNESVSLQNIQCSKLRLIGAQIKDDLILDGAQIDGSLNMSKISIGDSMFMRELTVEGTVSVTYGEILSVLLLKDTKISLLDLTGTKVNDLLDKPDSWPNSLRLNNFIYAHLGAMGREYGTTSAYDRPVAWFIDWLKRSEEYSPNIYTHCASILRKAGEWGKANKILYESKERERRSAGFWSGIGKSLLKISIGYGIGARYFLALFWAFLLSIIGVAVAASSTSFSQHSLLWWFAFSIDKLIPFVDLDSTHQLSLLHGWQRGYFFFIHQGLGALLAFFVVVGLTGLTNREKY